MPFTPEDLEALAGVIDSKINAAIGNARTDSVSEPTAEEAKQDYERKAGTPSVDPAAGPEYYVHLANGDVVESQDSQATHMEVDGQTVAVIGRYQKGL